MKTKKMTFAAMVAFMFFVVSATADVTWSISDGIGTASGSGEHAFDTAQSLSGMNVNATDGTLTLSGTGINFTGDLSEISLLGTSVFDLPLTSSGSLSFINEQTSVAYLTLKKDITAASLKIAKNVEVTADPGEILLDSDMKLPAMEVNGKLTITNASNIVFMNALSGAGEIYFGGSVDAAVAETKVTQAMSTEWQTVMDCGLVSSITNVSIAADGSEATGSTYHYKRSANTLVVQCQIQDGNWIKCAYLEFKQAATAVQARIKERWYCRSAVGLGVDFDTLEVTTSEPQFDSMERCENTDYTIEGFTLYCDSSSLMRATFDGANNQMASHAKFHQRGGIARILNKDALTTGGGSQRAYLISDGGLLVLDIENNKLSQSFAIGRWEMRATDGSMIILNKTNQLSYDRQQIYLDNSTLFVNNNGNSYINFITLENGSRITGPHTPRVGYYESGTLTIAWKVSGSSPSYLDTDLTTISQSQTICFPLVFDVEDVTGDEEADFIVNGSITPGGGGNGHMTFYKRGSGTMLLNKLAQSNYPVSIDDGTLLLGASDILCKDSVATAVQFGGGTLAGAAATSNAVGYVTLTNNSQIAVGEGAVFTFPDCSGQAWTDGMKLSITGAVDGKSVRFGTSRAALTDAQQAALRLNGKRAVLDSDGYVRFQGRFALVIR